MTTATTTRTRTTRNLDLAALGFAPEQIARLEQLKRSYSAFSEQFESDREFQQVAFLKWRYDHGDIQRG
jgi:hypothetical protein